MAAEQTISSATSAVTGELTRILFSGLMGRLDRQAADKKLRRLGMLVIKIHSAVEASEKHAIDNTWLLKWRDTLKVAAAEGEQVLASFRQPLRAMAAARGPGDDAYHEQEQQERPSSSSSTTTVSVATTKTPASDEDIQRLNSAVERLEELSPEIGMFLKLLKLEILRPEHVTTEARSTMRDSSPGQPPCLQLFIPEHITAEYPHLERARKARTRSGSSRSQRGSGKPHGHRILTPDQRTTDNTESIVRAAKRKRPSSASSGDGLTIDLCGWQMDEGIGALPLPAPSVNKMQGGGEHCGRPREEERWSTLFDRLEGAFAVICRAVELADGRDLTNHEWLAYWASLLRDAKGQGSAVLGAIRARRGDIVFAINAVGASGSEKAVAGCDDDREDSELGRFVCGMETLAEDVDYFARRRTYLSIVSVRT